MIEIRVIGDDAEAIKKDIAFLAEQFGVVTGEVAMEQKSGDTLVGSATAESAEPKKRGRKSNAAKAAEALSPAPPPPVEVEEPGEDPFASDDEEEKVDLEALKKGTIERLQRLAATKGGADTVAALLTKHGRGEKKFSKLAPDAFPAIAKDLGTLGVA